MLCEEPFYLVVSDAAMDGRSFFCFAAGKVLVLLQVELVASYVFDRSSRKGLAAATRELGLGIHSLTHSLTHSLISALSSSNQ
jgi:hypothetical protein